MVYVPNHNHIMNGEGEEGFMKDEVQTRWVSAGEACRMLAIRHMESIYRLLQSGTLVGRKISEKGGGHDKWQISRASVEAYDRERKRGRSA